MPPRRPTRVLDWTTAIGLPLGIGLVLAGQALEGGSVQSIVQSTAALIVVGGTACAVLVGFTFTDVKRAVLGVRDIVVDTVEPIEATIAEIVRLATHARRHGIISLEDLVGPATDPFLRTSLNHAIDGAKPQTVRELMELAIANQEEFEETPARVWESAGGYAPTMGILGAVLGLIQVMQHLETPDQIGSGIAIAFVATVYGVGLANLVFLPIATKMRNRARRATRRRELIMEGVLGIQDGLNPRTIEEKLRAFVADAKPKAPAARRKAA